MQPGMTTAAQCDLPGRFLPTRPAMVDQQLSVRETNPTTAVPPEHLFTETAEILSGMPLAVIAGSAESLREQRRTATGPAPPGRLSHWSVSSLPLPCPAVASTWIEASGKPLSSAASRSWRSNQVELRDESCGRSQTPAQS